MSQAILEMKNINKSFGTVPVLKNVNFSLKKGEIHALVGGNGAGKSTLMKIMTGIYIADSGEIFLNGNKLNILTPQDAQKNGIAMIFQELSLVQTMSIAENVFLGKEEKRRFYIDKNKMKVKTAAVLESLGLNIDPDVPVSGLSVGMSQMVEIAKALSKNSSILVLDEPTASLSDSETEYLFRILRDLKNKSVSIIYISHRMNEILDIADSITILKDGEHVITDDISSMDLSKIINYMTGGASTENRFSWVERKNIIDSEDILQVEHLEVNKKINDISFSVKKGEILGFAGLMGSGRTEVLEALFGMRNKSGGTIRLNGNIIENRSTADAVKEGFALIPEDRRKKGLVLIHSVKDNVILPSLRKLRKRKSLLLNEEAANKMVKDSISELNVVTDGMNKQIKLLSGGNQQKVVISKWLNTDPQIMMLDEPTAGVDISSKTEIMEIIRGFANKGKGVIFVSSEMTEMMAVCDRIVIMYDGHITRIIKREELHSEEELQHAIQEK